MNNLSDQCYKILQQIPRGKLTTYKHIANALNSKAYRFIGQLMKHNPHPIRWPCHRVIMSSGHIGGYAFGKEEKIKLLTSEGVKIKNSKILNLEKHLFIPNNITSL